RLPTGHQVPHVSLETVLHDRAGARRAPDAIGLGRAIVGAAKKRVEPADMVHVQMREEQIVDTLNFAEGELVQAAVAAVKEQAADGLAGVDCHEQGIVAAGLAKHAKSQAHRYVSLPLGQQRTDAVPWSLLHNRYTAWGSGSLGCARRAEFD